MLWTYSADPDTGQPLSSGNKVSGVGPVCVSIRYNGLSPGTNYTYEWYHNGVLIKQGQDEVDADSGHIVRCHHFIMGSMEFVLQVGDLAVRSDPVIFEQRKAPPGESMLRCGPLRFWGVHGRGDDYTPIGGSRFVQGTYDLTAQWRCHNAPVGSPYSVTWLHNGKPVRRQEGVLDKSTANFMENLADQDAPAASPGTYRMVFEVAGQVALAGEFVIEGFGGFSSQPSFDQLAFATRFDENARRPLDSGSDFYPGVTEIYAYWPYRDSRVGTPVRVAWFHNGTPLPVAEGSFDSSQGLYWAKTSRPDSAPLDPGTYRAVVEVGGQTVLADDCSVSRDPPTQKQYGPLVFASTLSEDTEEPLDPGTRFPYGVRSLYALWPYHDVTPGTPFTKKWYFNEELLSENEGTFGNSDDTMWNRLRYNSGMPLEPGPYMIKIEIGPLLAFAPGRLMITEPDEAVYGPVVFSDDFNEEKERPSTTGTQFSYGIPRVWAYWAYRKVPVETPYTFTWFRDGAPVVVGEGVLDSDAGKKWHSLYYDDGTPLERGNYYINVVVDGVVVVAESFVVE